MWWRRFLVVKTLLKLETFFVLHFVVLSLKNTISVSNNVSSCSGTLTPWVLLQLELNAKIPKQLWYTHTGKNRLDWSILCFIFLFLAICCWLFAYLLSFLYFDKGALFSDPAASSCRLLLCLRLTHLHTLSLMMETHLWHFKRPELYDINILYNCKDKWYLKKYQMFFPLFLQKNRLTSTQIHHQVLLRSRFSPMEAQTSKQKCHTWTFMFFQPDTLLNKLQQNISHPSVTHTHTFDTVSGFTLTCRSYGMACHQSKMH